MKQRLHRRGSSRLRRWLSRTRPPLRHIQIDGRQRVAPQQRASVRVSRGWCSISQSAAAVYLGNRLPQPPARVHLTIKRRSWRAFFAPRLWLEMPHQLFCMPEPWSTLRTRTIVDRRHTPRLTRAPACRRGRARPIALPPALRRAAPIQPGGGWPYIEPSRQMQSYTLRPVSGIHQSVRLR